MNLVNWFVQLNPALQPFIELGITLVFSFLVLQVAKVIPALSEYLGQYKVAIVTWLTGIAVQLLQSVLNKIPLNWEEVAFAAQKLFVEVLLVLFAFAAIRHFKVKGYQALQ